LLSHITQKTLASIHTEEAITQIINKALPHLFELPDTDSEFNRNLCDWLKNKVPTLKDEHKKVKVITKLIELSEKHVHNNKHQQTCIITTINRTLQSIQQIESKIVLMKYIVSHAPQPDAWTELFTIMYEWVERTIPDVSDATVREDILFQLLHRVQHK